MTKTDRSTPPSGSKSDHPSSSSSSSANSASSTTSDILRETLALAAAYIVSNLVVTYVVRPYFLQINTASPSSRSVTTSSGGPIKRLKSILLSRHAEESSDNNDGSSPSSSRPKINQLSLNQYEVAISADVIDPSHIPTRFGDIGGIDAIKSELWDLVVLPLLRPDLFSSSSGLVSPPRGVLLYGAPGTGKTMLAKAIAAEGSAAFINVRLSSIMDKWFGESNKLVSATFSLASKLAPSVIFIDELDTFLSQRDGSEGSATSSMKSEFLTLWDGMLTRDGSNDNNNADGDDDNKGSSNNDNNNTIMVLGATNRPFDVDSAILRRLPRTFEIGLPPEQSRRQILELFLKKQEMTAKAREMIPDIAKATTGYSGSDLKEMCRAAAMEPIRELMRESSQSAVRQHQNNSTKLVPGKGSIRQQQHLVGPKRGVKARPVSEQDFLSALKKVKRTGESAREFQQKDNSAATSGANRLKVGELAQGLQMLHQLFNNSQSSLNTFSSNDDHHHKLNDDGDEDTIPDLALEEK